MKKNAAKLDQHGGFNQGLSWIVEADRSSVGFVFHALTNNKTIILSIPNNRLEPQVF